MKVALVHDHLAQDGGAEKILKVLADLFPDAPIYTLLYEKKQVDKYFKNRHIEYSVIQKLPGGVKHYQWYMPFMPMAVEFFDLRSFDVVISDASAFAKGVITPPDTLHICYCHTPTRYIWDYTHQYINELKYNRYFKKVISLVLNYIRLWDGQAANRVDKFIANSKTVQRRIAKYYRRDSTVIYPPVELDKFSVAINQPKKDEYFLIGGRLAPYKRVDVVIEAFRLLDTSPLTPLLRKERGTEEREDSGKRLFKLKIFGDGVDLERLKKLANKSKNIEFLGRVDDEIKAELYRNCLAFINPQEEDFGITAVEAMASGRPVIAYKKGGATETVIDDVTGLFFNKQTVDNLANTIANFDARRFNPQRIREHAERFGVERFKREIREFIDREWKRLNTP